MSYEEFLDLGDEYRHAEWVNGEVIMMAAVTDVHALLVMFLSTILKGYVDARQLGGVFAEPFQMKTGPNLPGRAPDLFFVAKDRLGYLRDKNFEGPADLVIEVISKGTRRVDRVNKFQEYETGGVKEYWLLDPIREIAEFYVLVNGQFEERDPDPSGIYRSVTVNGFWIDVAWLWRVPLPSTIECLRQLAVL